MKKPLIQTGRRNLLQAATAGAVGALAGCNPWNAEPQSPVAFVPGQPLPWINWAGNQTCTPMVRLAPQTEAELADALKNAQGVVRAVGASHSFSAVVPTNDTLIATDLLSGLISHDPATHQAEIWAGTRMHQLGPMLDSVGQALPNMPDMDYPAMGGAIANSVHATGKNFGSMSSYVVGLTLATPSGDLLECSATENTAVFQAARGGYRSKKLRSMSWPCAVRIDSGWNCTPCTGRLRCASPMISSTWPSAVAVHAVTSRQAGKLVCSATSEW